MHKEQKCRRTKLLVGRPFRDSILKRAAFYWGACILFITLSLALCGTLAEPDRFFVAHLVSVWSNHWPVFVALSAILPFITYDVLRVSSRFAGPIFRLTRTLQQYNDGGEYAHLRFREDDQWHDLAEHVNHLVERVDSQRSERVSNSGEPFSEEPVASAV